MYRDVQRMKDTWIYKLVLFIALAITTLFLYGMYIQIIKGHPWGTSPMSNRGLIITVLLIVLIDILSLAFLRATELVVEVREDGIYYQLKPFHKSLRRIGFSEIKKIEFISGGLRYGIGIHFGVRWKAYTVSGKQVKIDLINGSSVILSVSSIEKFKDALSQAGFWT